MTTPQAARPAPVPVGVLLTILLAAQLMAILDVNVVNVAGATIRADLHTGGSGLQLIITGYAIAYAVLLITGARLGSRLGYRRTFLLGLAGFTAASLACGLAASSGQLIAFRFVQGGTAAVMIPQVFSLIQRYFTGATRVRALALYAVIISGGIVLGQILGGVLVDANVWGTGWRPIFMINVPFGLIVLAFGVRLLPQEAPDPPRRLDLPGLLLLAAAVLALVVPLVLGHEEGWPVWCWVGLGLSALLAAGFAVVQRRVTTPLMPSRVFATPGLLAALGAVVLLSIAYSGFLFTVALYLQLTAGYSPLRAGISFVPMALAFAVGSINWRRLPARWHALVIPAGLLVGAASLVALAFSLRGPSPVGWLFGAAQIPFGLGFGLAFSPAINHALARVRPEDAADASGLLTTSVQLAQVLGVATLGSLYLGLTSDAAAPRSAAVITVLVGAGFAVLAAGSAARLRRTTRDR